MTWRRAAAPALDQLWHARRMKRESCFSAYGWEAGFCSGIPHCYLLLVTQCSSSSMQLRHTAGSRDSAVGLVNMKQSLPQLQSNQARYGKWKQVTAFSVQHIIKKMQSRQMEACKLHLSSMAFGGDALKVHPYAAPKAPPFRLKLLRGGHSGCWSVLPACRSTPLRP